MINITKPHLPIPPFPKFLFPFFPARTEGRGKQEGVSLMGNKDLEARNNLSQGNRAIFFPFLNGFNVVDKDDEVVFFPVVVDSNLGNVAAGHDYLLIASFWERLGRVNVFVNVFLVTQGLLLLIWVVVAVVGVLLKYLKLVVPSWYSGA